MAKDASFKRSIMAALMIMILATAFGCTEKKPIHIGVVGTMTGPNSDLSVSGRRGVELAVDEINRKGGILGRSVDLVIKDDKNDKLIAKQVDQEFLEEGIKVIIGHYTSGMVVSTLDFMNENKMLLLGPTISADALTDQDDYFIRFISTTAEQASILADHIKETEDKRFVVVFDERNSGFTDQFVNNFSELFQKHMGNLPEIISYDPSVKVSFDAAVERISKLGPQGVLILAGAEDCARAAQQLKSKHSEMQLYGPLWANTPELIRKGGSAVEGMIVVGAIDMDNADETFVRFKTDYFLRYGDQPSFSALYSYEAMIILADAIEKSKSLDPSLIKSKMLEIGEFKGVQGQIHLNGFGDVKREYMLFKISDGKLKVVN